MQGQYFGPSVGEDTRATAVAQCRRWDIDFFQCPGALFEILALRLLPTHMASHAHKKAD